MSCDILDNYAPKVRDLPGLSNPGRGRQTKGKPSVNLTDAPGGQPHRGNDKGPKPKYFVGVDWFEATTVGGIYPVEDEESKKPLVNFTATVPKGEGRLPGRVELHHNQRSRRNKHYRYGYDVLVIPEGAKETDNRAAMLAKYKIGSASCVPHAGNNCLERSSILQLENHVLYRSDCWKVLNSVLHGLGWTVNHVTRLDICLDGPGLLDPVTAYHRDKMEFLYNGKPSRTFAKIGRADYDEARNGKGDRNWSIDGEGNVTNFYVGSLNSKKTLNGYAKGKRIEIENKQYIAERWRQVKIIPLDATGEDLHHIHRLETRYRKEAIDELFVPDPETAELLPFDWTRLDDPKYLAGVLKTSLDGFYGFVKDNGKHRNKWDEVPVIDWDAIATETVVKIPRTKKPSETWKAKHTARKLLMDAAADDYLADAAATVINEALTGYSLDPAKIDNLAWGIGLEMHQASRKELTRLATQAAQAIAFDIADHLTKVAGEIPEALAWAMADEHLIGGYIQKRLRKDCQQGYGNGSLAALVNRRLAQKSAA